MDPQPGDDVLLACSAEGAVTEIEPSPSHLPTAAVAAEETEKAILSLSEAAAKIVPSDLPAFLADTLDKHWPIPSKQILILVDYYGDKLSQVSFRWVKMFQETSLSTLIHVPFPQIPTSVYETSVDFINILPFETTLRAFVLWASDLILTEWPGVVKIEQNNSNKSKVATFVALAMLLRCKPDALTTVLPHLRETPTYQGEDKLPFIIWMMAQASQGDLSAGLYSWSRNLLPLVGNNKCYSPQAMDLILQFVEMILTNPEAPTILVNEAVKEGERLIPPSSFAILVQHTFPASSARVETTKRFEAIYPLLKEVALAPEKATGSDTMKQIFTFSLRLAGEGNPVLAKEAIAIAIRCVKKNVGCFKHWDNLYTENIKASVALLKKLVDDWKDHSIKLLSSPSDTLVVKRTIYSFRVKNDKAIAEGVANCFLYKEADKSCKVISGKLSRGSSCLKGTAIAVVILAAGAAGAAVLSSNPEVTAELKNLVESFELHEYLNKYTEVFTSALKK
ncbi:PREDICTED: uncharacterized protein LOC104719833 isoform X2 [Camelina sativa]|uniref:Uncharacterized protein LOC104719833 isoform X2 n=1 Tax=Camelina sativa TaxID=90675 RepID=A0ABM0U5I2_CAMSA|nr:PREDICTED: uncharacterized protein LOC104719833 isoform X2 [Camelina sativa]